MYQFVQCFDCVFLYQVRSRYPKHLMHCEVQLCLFQYVCYLLLILCLLVSFLAFLPVQYLFWQRNWVKIFLWRLLLVVVSHCKMLLYLRRRLSSAVMRANVKCLLERLVLVGEGQGQAGRRREWARREEEQARMEREAHWLETVTGRNISRRGDFPQL